MKKIILNVMAVAVLAVAMSSCGGGSGSKQIILVTESARIEFELAGTGEVTIDWGDGKVEPKTLSERGDSYSHDYRSAPPHVIISGENITQLICSRCHLTSLDVSKNTALTHLECDKNKLTSLDVSKNTALTKLICEKNQLTNLDVSKNTALTWLNCEKNQLTNLDVSKNTALT
jgi:hypothetical protein